MAARYCSGLSRCQDWKEEEKKKKKEKEEENRRLSLE